MADCCLFFKERLGLKLTHKRISTKVVLPVSRVRVLYRGSYKCVKKGKLRCKVTEEYKSPKVKSQEPEGVDCCVHFLTPNTLLAHQELLEVIRLFFCLLINQEFLLDNLIQGNNNLIPELKPFLVSQSNQ